MGLKKVRAYLKKLIDKPKLQITAMSQGKVVLIAIQNKDERCPHWIAKPPFSPISGIDEILVEE